MKPLRNMAVQVSPFQKRIAVVRRGEPSEALRAEKDVPNTDAAQLFCPFTKMNLRNSSIKKLYHLIISDDRSRAPALRTILHFSTRI